MRDAADPSERVFDEDLFASLREILGTAPLGALLEEAESEIARRLDAIAVVAGGDEGCGALRAPAHDLAGLAGQIGLAAMAAAARELERAVRAGDGGSGARAAETLLDLRARSLGALSKARAELGSG